MCVFINVLSSHNVVKVDKKQQNVLIKYGYVESTGTDVFINICFFRYSAERQNKNVNS